MSNAIEFKLLALYNKNATLIGTFSDWQEIPMEKDTTRYFRTVVELEDGVYRYKFRTQSKSLMFESDQWVEIIDPYAKDIYSAKQTGVVRSKDGKQVVDTY